MDKNLTSIINGIAAAPPLGDTDDWFELLPKKVPLQERSELAIKLEEIRKKQDACFYNNKGRLKRLRQEMKRQKIDGLIIPKVDEHQGEYIAKHSERLFWLSGFSGSAGQAIVLAKKAALFVDGRYVLQVKKEVCSNEYECINGNIESLSSWLSKNLKPNSKLSFDPWLHSENQIHLLQNICKIFKIKLIASRKNLIDKIWLDQPPPPISPIMTHSLAFAGETSKSKRQKVAKHLINHACTAQILTSPDSIAWLLNIRGNDIPFTPFVLSFAIVHKNGSVDWFVDEKKFPLRTKKSLSKDIKVHDPNEFLPVLKNLAKKKSTLLCDSNSTPQLIFEKLKGFGIQIIRGADPCQSLKSKKNKTELLGAQNAHLRDGVAVCNFLSWFSQSALKENETEISAANFLEAERSKNDLFRGLSFSTIAGYGSNGAIVHYRANQQSNKTIKAGSLILIDSGAQYLDGTTDITRTIAIGKPTQVMKSQFTRVLKGHIALASAKFPIGTTGSQLDTLARQFLWEVGLDYNHGTGHGVGSFLSVHEGPQRISKSPSPAVLRPGMIISNEPGYYKAGAYGIRIENLVMVKPAENLKVKKNKFLEFETLTLAPIDITLIDARLLTENEIFWINSYHERVIKNLLPLVNNSTKTWLKKTTVPIVS